MDKNPIAIWHIHSTALQVMKAIWFNYFQYSNSGIKWSTVIWYWMDTKFLSIWFKSHVTWPKITLQLIA